jgi:hypothetical protein
MIYKIKIKRIDKRRDTRSCPICREKIKKSDSQYMIESIDNVFHIRCYLDDEYQKLILEDVLSDEDKNEINKEIKAFTKEIMVEYF